MRVLMACLGRHATLGSSISGLPLLVGHQSVVLWTDSMQAALIGESLPTRPTDARFKSLIQSIDYS